MQTNSDRGVIIGKKLNNPFSMYNMEQALLSMIRRDAHSPADGKMYGEMLSEMLRLKTRVSPPVCM